MQGEAGVPYLMPWDISTHWAENFSDGNESLSSGGCRCEYQGRRHSLRMINLKNDFRDGNLDGVY